MSVENEGREVCIFCESLHGDQPTPRFKEMFPNLGLKDETLAFNTGWRVIPDTSPLTPHHLLILPFDHSNSCFEADNDKRADLLKIKGEVCDFLQTQLPDKKILLFEHGSGTTDEGLPVHCGVCNLHLHAHMHILPVADETPHNLESYLKMRLTTLNPDLVTIHPEELYEKTRKPYLYFSFHINEGTICLLDEMKVLSLEPQFFRYTIGRHLGCNDNYINYQTMHISEKSEARSRIEETLKLFNKF